MSGRLLALAARRWPARQREDLLRDWHAELCQLDREPGVSTVVRRWRCWRFIMSLVFARSGPVLPLTMAVGVRGAADPAAFSALARGRWRYLSALAMTLLAIVSWALTLTYLPPHIGDGAIVGSPSEHYWPGFTTDEARLWLVEWRLFGIAAVIVGLVVAAIHRGLPAWPACLAGAGLAAADLATINGGRAVPASFPALLGIGVGTAGAAWLVMLVLRAMSRRPLRDDAGARLIPDRRRSLAAVATFALFLSLGMTLVRLGAIDRIDAPPVLAAATLGPHLALLTVALIGLSTLTGRTGTGPVWRRPLLVAAASVPLWWILYADGLLSAVLGLAVAVVLGLGAAPAAVVAMVVMGSAGRGVPVSRRPRPAVVAAVLVSPFAMLVAVGMGSGIGPALFAGFRYYIGYDGMPWLPGMLFFGTVLATVAGATVHRLPDTAPIPSGR